MQNAYERFGSLEFIKRTKEMTTRVRVHIDRAVLETPKDERGQASAHLISMIGGDSEIGALWAAATEGALFQIQLPDQPSFAGSVGPEAQCLRGSVMVPGRKRPVRHLVAVSAELAKTKPGADREGALTILVRRRSSVCPLSRCLAISPSSGFGVGILVYARTESTKGDYAVARARLLASSGQGQQENVAQILTE